MTAPRSIVTSVSDMQPVSGDLIVAKAYERPRGVNGGAVAHVTVRAAEAKADGRLAALLEGIGDAFYSLDGDWRFTSINRAAQEHFGIPAGEMLGRVIWDVVPGSEGTELRRRYEDVLATGVAASFEARSVIAPDRTLEFRVFPYDGGIAVSFRDRTERCRAEDYLKESQAQLSALADHLPLGMVYQMSDADNLFDRRFIYVSASCERLNGVPAERALKDPSALYDLLLPEFREPVFRTQAEAHVTGRPFDMEIVIRHGATGESRWQRIVATRRTLPDGGAVWDGLQIDITDHKQSEEHLRLLIHELNHRVKNTLATVQSLAAQSFGRLAAHADDEVRAARRAFEARLLALARGHDVLTRENWESALLSDIVSESCAPYGAAGTTGRARIAIEGPDLRIAPPMALSLSMTLHELFTNALKFGALSRPAGRIRIGWSVLTDSDGLRLRMRWEERGGPPVAPPSRMGFGSRLIQAGLARELNGSAHIAYEPEGVVCTIDVPVS
ncbi:sensor histidine kinase [Microvirga sp. TS319]|uniref:sensor histidine kinase n=1 Tax=Microvirga sp. TS319 TaxID=3241165 RepID=UPI003519E4B7